MTDTILTTAETVATVIASHRYRFNREDQLQEGVAAALTSCGFTVAREVALTGADRIDMLVGRTYLPGGSVGVEVKLRGGVADVGRQLLRYAHSPLIDELVLVTPKPAHAAFHHTIGGKPLHVVVIGQAI